jgi:hypothetical protein
LTWSAVPAPAVTNAKSGYPLPSVSIRFANGLDGWIYALHPNRLWSTHDGGNSWKPVFLAQLTPDAIIMSMEAAAGRVQLAIFPSNAATIHIESSPVSVDAWTDTATGIPVGAGPVPSAQLVLQQSQGWLLEDDRTVVGGARLNGDTWQGWTPPCLTADGSATLAASTPANLVAVCVEGVWGPPRNLPGAPSTPSTWFFESSDGGASFEPVGQVPVTPGAQSVAAPTPTTTVLASSGSTLWASFDGGHSWRVVYQNGELASWWYLGFTTATQGVAIGAPRSGSSLMLMTRDGGQHWATVSFRAAS